MPVTEHNTLHMQTESEVTEGHVWRDTRENIMSEANALVGQKKLRVDTVNPRRCEKVAL